MLTVIDFETKGIQALPDYPPEPVGLAVYTEGYEPYYLSWGHPTNNNSTKEKADAFLASLYADPSADVVAHNAPFDTAVAHEHDGVALSPAGDMHDTMVMAFLLDPHAFTYALKPMCEKMLGMPPEEQDAVHDWLYSHGIIKKNQKDWGAYIWMAPGDLVGTYAIGDVVRTMKLYKHFKEKLVATKMWDAYRREMSLQPIMLENTFDGICVDVDRLACDIRTYDNALEQVTQLLFQELGTAPFNLDSDMQLADAIDKAHPGLVWTLTKTGKRSTSKANMEKTLEGLTGMLEALMQYRASINTCVNTFMRPWLTQATHPLGGGRIRCEWRTTRSDDGGARTGRLSSSPNFQNIPTLESAKFKQSIKLHAKYLSFLPPLPNVRSYIVSDSEDDVLCGRDFSGQELRVLAHFEDGVMLENYRKDPHMDMHQLACDMILEMIGLVITRKQTKTVNFAITYGSGLTTLAKSLGCDVDEAGKIKAAYLSVLPGIAELGAQMKQRAREGLPIRTWGGRLYYVEPPKFVDGRWRTYDYKLLNVLVQGSSADITKEACIEYNKRKVHGRLLLTVHDEIVINAPKEHALTEMAILKDCMEGVKLDAKLISDGEFGRNWFELTPEETEDD